jgi:hypothetical protein
MPRRLLITFGCSWTYGVGVGHEPGMSLDEYKAIAWKGNICSQLSFRGLLSKKYGFKKNINFSQGGSSNQLQFRLAKEFFPSDEFKKLQSKFDQIIVLWGITSTARNELYFNSCNHPENFFYSYDMPEAKVMTKYFYNHEYEVAQLLTNIRFWNDYFKSKNISNLWFDTFNHHEYEQFVLENLIFTEENPRDLLSKLAIKNGQLDIDTNYHTSDWQIDSNRIEYLVNIGILNRHSLHPTQQGHAQISEMLAPYIESLI